MNTSPLPSLPQRCLRAALSASLGLALAAHLPSQAQGLRLPGTGSGLQLGGMEHAGSAPSQRAQPPGGPATEKTTGKTTNQKPAQAKPAKSGQAPYANDLRDAASNAQASSRTAAAGASSRQADYIVALVNSVPITHVELQSRMENANAMLAQQGQSISQARLRQEVLDLLIAEQLQLQEAKDLKLSVDDFTLEQAERSVAEQNGVSVTAMYQELAAGGIGRDQFRNQLRNQLTLMRVRERAVESRVRVSDQELDRYLREHPQELGQRVPDAINLGHILVVVPERASPAQEAELKKRIESAQAQLAQGRSLADVARDFSDASEARHGGELGLRPVTHYPDLFLQAIQGQPVGAIVGPIRSPAGYHLLQVLEHQSGGADMVVRNHARHILIKPSSGRSAQEAGELLMEIRQRVENGEDFADLARQYSQDGSAGQGGDLGWAGPGLFVPEFQEAIDELRPGDISRPIVSRYGLHLIQLLDRRQDKITQREQRELVRGQAREEKVQKEYIRWIEGLRARAFIEMRDGSAGD